MPCVSRSWKLAEHRCCCLKKDGISKCDNASGRMQVRSCSCEFEQIEAHEPHVNHIACYACNADAVANANAVAADKEEIRRDTEQDGLQSDSEARSDESGECRQRTEVADDAEDKHQANQESNDKAANEKELPPSADVRDIAEDGALPKIRDQKKNAEHGDENGHGNEDGAQNRAVLAGD